MFPRTATSVILLDMLVFVEAVPISSRRVLRALQAVDRADFAPSNPYIDAPQPLGENQRNFLKALCRLTTLLCAGLGETISAPHMVSSPRFTET